MEVTLLVILQQLWTLWWWICLDLHGKIQLKSQNFNNPGFNTRVNTLATRENTPEPWLPRQLHGPDCFTVSIFRMFLLVCDLNRTPIVMANHGGPCVHFSGISTCGRTSGETVSHPQHPPLPTLCKISLPVYVIATNEQLQPLTATWHNSLVLSISLLTI